MSSESPPPSTPSLSRGRPRRRLPRVPPFYPVPLRQIRNGWSEERQAHFLGFLAETGSVSAACARVGMSRKGAYQLRRKPHAESFAAAWDAALGWPVRKVTVDEWDALVHDCLLQPRFRCGRYVGYRRKRDAALLSRLLREVELRPRRRGC